MKFNRNLFTILVAILIITFTITCYTACTANIDKEHTNTEVIETTQNSETTPPTNVMDETTVPSEPIIENPTIPSEDDNDEEDTTVSMTGPSEDESVPTEPVTKPSEAVKPTEPSEPVTKPTTPTNPTKPSETTKPTNPTKPSEPKPTVPTEPKPITPTVPTTPTKPSEPSEPTVPSKPTEPTPTVPTPPDEEDEPVVEEPYFVKMELVSVERPNAHYIDGVDMLTYMFGKNKALQKGDSVTYRIVMSDGGNEGFTIGKTYGFSATLDGNLLTITATGTAQSGAWVSIRSVNESGEPISKSVEWDYVIKDDGNLFENDGKMAHLLKRYAKFLGFTVKDGAQMTGYTTNTGGTMESLTGCTVKDNDDRIVIPDNPDWIEEVIWLFREYKKLGFKNVSFHVIYADSYHGCAD